MSDLQKITQEQMDAAGVVAAPDVLSGTASENKAIFDRMVRQLVAPAYNAAVDAINAMNQTESGIQAAEADRIAAEQGRVSAEEGRANAEQSRVSAEETRATAEQKRAAAETERVQAESGRGKAEGLRAEAEESRAQAETERASAEQSRESAEEARKAAEEARENTTNGIVAQATAQAEAAAKSASGASASASQALDSRTGAETAAENAARSAGEAQTSREGAAEKAEAAEAAAGTAQTAAQEASGSAGQAALYAEAAEGSKAAAQTSETAAKDSAKRAESWAVGGTGNREEEDTNNAKYWAGQAQAAAGGGVVSFNGRSGSVKPEKGDYTAEEVGAIPQINGAAGQLLGFTAENVVGAVDAPEGGGATQKDFLIFSGWTTSEYTIRDSFFELGGYTYIVGPSAMNQSFFDVYENLGLSAYDISKNGELKLTCKGPPPAQIGLTVIKIKTGYTTSKAYCINHFWIDVDEILTSVVPKSKILVSAKSYIPNGRMLGDVDGDGQITAEDANLINKAAVGSVELTPIQIQCADIDGDSSITTSDSYYINKVLNGSSKIGEYFRDILNNWSVNPDYETDEAQFYIDIPVSGLTASSDIALAVQGDEADQIVRVEAMSGAFRVYAKLLPINPLPYMLLENSDSSGTKSFSVTLSASDWSGNQLNKLDDSWPDMTDKSVIASPAPGSLVAAAASGVYCSDAEKQSLTFTCSTLPEEDIVYNISVLGG